LVLHKFILKKRLSNYS